jgi:hypothetical protein
MGRGTTTWKRPQEALRQKGVVVGWRGSEAKLVKRLATGEVLIYILQHKCCDSPSAVVWATHVSRIKKKFGITNEDLKG